MRIPLILILLALSAPLAFAQGWAQPVREIEKEARNVATGSCVSVNIPSGSSGNSGPCTLYVPALGTIAKVPADKFLVIEDVQMLCDKRASDAFESVQLRTQYYGRDVPLTLRSTSSAGIQRWRGASVVRMYAPPASSLTLTAFVGGNADFDVQCSAYFQGHLISAQ